MKKSIVALFAFASLMGYAQQNNPLINSQEIAKKGYEYMAEEKYRDAINEFLKVPRNDTNFIPLMIDVTSLYAREGKDSLTVILCDELLKDKVPQRNKLIIAKANAYDNMKKYDLAEKTYIQAETECPNDYLSFFNHGLMYHKQDKYAKADEYYIKALKINFYHVSSLYRLGLSQIKQGKISTAMMALQMMLLLENNSERASNALGVLEQLVKGELENDMTHKQAYADNDDFSDLDEIIKSRLAISDKYKSKTKLDYALVKQVQVFHEKIKAKKGSSGFFMTYFAPFFEGIQKNKFLEPMEYTLLGGTNIDDVKRWNKSNESKVKKFSMWAAQYLNDNALTYEDDLNGQRVKAVHYFSNGQLAAIGNHDEKGMNVGYWKFYHDIYTLKSEGNFVEDKKNGKWKFYYEDGTIKEESEFKDNLYNGVTTEYYPIGTPRITVNYEMGVPKGLITLYNSAGQKTTEFTLINNVKEGKVRTFYTSGEKEVEIDYVKGKGEGKYMVYYQSGKVKEETTISNDARNGPTVGYFDNDKKSTEFKGSYKNNEAAGEWKYYNEKGALTSEGVFDERGKKNGKWKVYHSNGKLAEEYEYSKGNIDGEYKIYDTTGTLFATYDYKNGIVKSYTIGQNGKVLASAKESSRELVYETYSLNGNRTSKGKFVNGVEEGKWEFYNANGYKTGESTYKEGKLVGDYLRYHSDGKVRETTPYKDGSADGYSKKYFTNSNLLEEGWFVNGSRQGYWLVYWPDGKIKYKYYYLNDELHGWQTTYAVNGKIAFEEKYDKNKLVGMVYYDTLGVEESRIYLQAGTGQITDKYMNGNTRISMTYKGGEANGPFEWTYGNKQKESVGSYINGDRHGKFITYFPTGQKSGEYDYAYGQKQGKSMDYYENGAVREDYTYDHGETNGTAYSYHENGKKSREAQYENGQAQGHIRLYDENGEMILDRTYDEDRLVSLKGYSADMKQQKTEVKNETGKYVFYFPNGKKAFEAEYKNGFLDGKRLTYHSTGKPYEDETFENGEEEGVSKKYFSNGNLRVEANYLLGSYHGKCTRKYSNGNLRSIEYYQYGYLHGKCYYYNEKGELEYIRVYYNDHLYSEEKVK